MPKYFWISLLLCCWTSLAAAESDSLDSLLRLANAAEAAENWSEAQTIYDSLYEAGYRSADLFLNQGNAYLADEQLGYAILAYERGLRWRPGHRDLLNNRAIAQSQLSLQLTRFPEFFLWRWSAWLGSRLGQTGLQLLGLAAWWLAVGAFAWWYFKKEQLSDRIRFLLLPLAGVCLLLFLACWWLGNFRADSLQRSDQAIIVAPQVDLVAAPAEDATYELTAYEGLRARIIDGFAGYRKIELDNGRRGWVPATAMEII